MEELVYGKSASHLLRESDEREYGWDRGKFRDGAVSDICYTGCKQGEEKAVKCAVRCDAGYRIEGDTTIRFVGDHAVKWKAALDCDYRDGGDALTNAVWKDTLILGGVDSFNTVFWVKASSSVDENPQNDTSVDIQAEGLVVAT